MIFEILSLVIISFQVFNIFFKRRDDMGNLPCILVLLCLKSATGSRSKVVFVNFVGTDGMPIF